MRKKAQPHLPLGTYSRKGPHQSAGPKTSFHNEKTVVQGRGKEAGGPVMRQKPGWVSLGPLITSGVDLIPQGGGSVMG